MRSSLEYKPANQWRIGWGLTRYVLRATLRNRAGYFFSFLFPLVFVVVFGLFDTTGPSLRLGVEPGVDRTSQAYRAVEAAVAGSRGAVVLEAGEPEQLYARLRAGRLAAVLTAPTSQGQGLALLVAGESPHGTAGAAAFVRAALAQAALREARVATPAYEVAVQPLPGRRRRHIDFALPGQIGFSLLALATFGVGYQLSTLRRTLVLKRMLATEVLPLTFVIAQGLARSLQAVLQAALLLGFGVVAFGFHLERGWLSALEMVVLSFLGVISFLGFGILMTNLADDEHTLPVALNLFNLPQVLLAGVFFPIDLLPSWLQGIGSNLPLAYLNTALRNVSLDGATLLQQWPAILGMAGWACVSYVLAARTFRLE